MLHNRSRGHEDSASRSVVIVGTRGYPSYYGGFETLVRKLAPFLSERGWQVTVYSRPRAVAATADRHDGVLVRNTIGVDSKSLSTLSFGATSILDAAVRRPSVALVMNVANGYWLPLLRSRHIPSVMNVDGIEWERDKWSSTGKAVFKMGAKMAARFADVLITDSRRIAEYWDENFHRSSRFIPYGGDPVAGNLEAAEGLPKGSYVLFVARLVPENTVAEFLSAAERLARRHSVVVVGSSGNGGPFEQRLRTLERENTRIRWMGHIADDARLYALWQNCGVYFHGHSVGGTNPALVQAMACGAPIVARQTPYNVEVLDAAGVFVEPTSDAIEIGVEGLLCDVDRRADLSTRARLRAEQHYSWESTCDSYEKALQTAIDINRKMRTQR